MDAVISSNNCSENITPSRKRKRESNKFNQECVQGVQNIGFSFMLQKEARNLIDSYNRLNSTANRKLAGSNKNPFPNKICLEVKSIAEIIEKDRKEPENPYEVIRKPPKKKKKPDIEGSCFENPALNLDIPEKKFNPFEVKRENIPERETNCFSNHGLNIRVVDNSVSYNPFEITRCKEFEKSTVKEGIENPALEIPSSSISIGLPFQPTVGCRIDFNKMKIEGLTPTKMFAEKLVFTTPTTLVEPDPALLEQETPNKSFRRSLSVISEELLDIGEELDCYQLELENSINEAKLRKNNFAIDKTYKSYDQEEVLQSSGDEHNEVEPPKVEIVKEETPKREKCDEDQSASSPKDTENAKEEHNILDIPSQEGFEYASDEDDDDYPETFKKPTPFVRAYRKPAPNQNISTEGQNGKHGKSVEVQVSPSILRENTEKKNKISTAIRKSIRKFTRSVKTENNKIVAAVDNNSDGGVENKYNIFSSIRYSLRRRPKITTKNGHNKENEISDPESLVDNVDKNISILDTTERKVFKSNLAPEEEINKKKWHPDKVAFSRDNTIRRSSRIVRNKVMKSVFKKSTEGYNL